MPILHPAHPARASPARIVCLPAIYVKVTQYIEFIRI